jgi:ABC-type multidrug transport system fused ATPase/permease subunit
MSLQPITPGSIVARIWEIYRNQFSTLVGTATILYALQFVVYLVLSSAAGIILTLLFWALGVLYQGMVVKLVQDIQDGRRDHSVRALIASVSPVFWPLLAVGILFGIGVAIGFVLVIIPGLYLLVIWSVVAPVTVLERPGVFAAFGRSRELVRGDGWSVFGVILIVFVAVVVVSVAAGLAASGLGSVGRALVQWAVNAAVAPVSALSASVLYFALRSRRSGPPVSEPVSMVP